VPDIGSRVDEKSVAIRRRMIAPHATLRIKPGAVAPGGSGRQHIDVGVDIGVPVKPAVNPHLELRPREGSERHSVILCHGGADPGSTVVIDPELFARLAEVLIGIVRELGVVATLVQWAIAYAGLRRRDAKVRDELLRVDGAHGAKRREVLAGSGVLLCPSGPVVDPGPIRLPGFILQVKEILMIRQILLKPGSPVVRAVIEILLIVFEIPGAVHPDTIDVVRASHSRAVIPIRGGIERTIEARHGTVGRPIHVRRFVIPQQRELVAMEYLIVFVGDGLDLAALPEIPN
jgi:hypothetical protein